MLTFIRTGHTIRLVILVMFFMVAQNSSAHLTLLDIEWCSGEDEQLIYVAQFDLGENRMRSIISQRPSVDIGDIDPLGPPTSNGQLDHDDYAWARASAYYQCYDINPLAQPIFYGPEEFLLNSTEHSGTSSQNQSPLTETLPELHHRLYALRLRLYFGCYICRSKLVSD